MPTAQTPVPELGPFLVNGFGDRYLHAVNGTAFNRVGAQALFRQQFGERLAAEDMLNLIVGSDSGLLIKELLRQGVPPGSRFLFIEPDAVHARVAAELADLELGDGLILAPASGWRERLAELPVQDYLYLGNLRVVRSLAATDALLSDYQGLYWAVRQHGEQIGWEIQLKTNSRPFIVRQIENLAEAQFPAAPLADRFGDTTAVLLGGGPSLPRLLPWIERERGRLVVIAVSRICRQLLAAGITPDIVVSIDPHAVSFDVSKELLRLDPRVLFIHSYHVSPLLLGQWHGRSAYLGPRYPWAGKHNPPNLPMVGPTVTNTALAVAVAMGCRQVVLGGVDLCFSREGYTHAAGSNEAETGPLLGAIGVPVETNDGGSALSREDFVAAIASMGAQATRAAEAGCRIINPIAEAARIPGVDHVALDAIVPADPSEPPGARLARLIPVPTPAERVDYLRAVDRELARVNGRLRDMKRLAIDALGYNDGLFGRNGKPADFKYKHRMDKIERRLDSHYKDLAPTIKSFGDRHFLRLIRPKEREWSDAEIEATGRAYYEAYRDTATNLLEEVGRAQQRVRSRLDEEAAAPGFDALIDQWQRDEQPGRARVWRERHPAATPPVAVVTHFEALEQAFEAVLAERQTGQMEWVRREYSLKPVRAKARTLLQRRDAAGLDQLAAGIALAREPAPAGLAELIDGFRAELAADEEGALACYEAVINAVGDPEATAQRPLLEDALNRIATLYLNRHDGAQALLATQCLADLSPAYAPSYAGLLVLTGRAQEAIAVYNDYLTRAPDDTHTMLKLGQLYRQLGVVDAAQMAFRYVIERDPGSQAAHTMLAELEASR